MEEKDYNELVEKRNNYYELEVGSNEEKEKIWIKKLRNILEQDIHKKPLGCKISNTHIKIGKVHLDTFYEAQILFAHPRWVDRFSEWIKNTNLNVSGDILFIGYETYIEPVLFSLKKKYNCSNYNFQVDYCIYEEQKYIRSKTISDKKIRYLTKHKNKSYDTVIFICGISSTLNTFSQMKKLFDKNAQNLHITAKNFKYLSLIQVLPVNSINGNTFNFDICNYIKWDKNSIVLIDNNTKAIETRFLLSVNCKWFLADNCDLCFPKNPVDEFPIVETSETSVIPVQMIEREKSCDNNIENQKDNIEIKNNGLNIFERVKGSHGATEQYLYEDYLYYNHIDRDDHHYKYYIRTGNLFYDIYYGHVSGIEKFYDFCNEIKKEINKKKRDICQSDFIVQENTDIIDKPIVNILICPAHFSDALFPNAINENVFNGKAHIISFDPKKEYRSNFETKYSNLAYFLDQIKSSHNKNKVEIRFYFVDDQLVTGSTFYRAKSLVTSLMKVNGTEGSNVKIFNGIIIMLSRISKETKFDYIEDTQRFFSFININVPSIRNYGDSCPNCNFRMLTEKIISCCALDHETSYWNKKHYLYRVKSLIEAKEEYNKSNNKNRNFRRFEYEDKIWRILKSKNVNNEDYLQEIISKIFNKSNEYRINCEDFIAIIKAISGPFMYYKEKLKKVTLNILIQIMETYLTQKNISYPKTKILTIKVKSKSEIKFSIIFNNNYEKYILFIVGINSLARINSTYLLNVQRINRIYDLSKKLYNIDKAQWNDIEEIELILLSAYKRIICGIAGDKRRDYMVKKLDDEYITCKGAFTESKRRLFESMILESITPLEIKTLNYSSEKEKIELDHFKELFVKYNRISVELKKEKDLIKDVFFYYYDEEMCGNTERIYKLTNQTEQLLIGEFLKNEEEVELEKYGYLLRDSEAIFTIKFFKDEDAIYNKKKEKIKVYLVVVYEDLNTFNDYYEIKIKLLHQIREVLKYKYSLSQQLYNDIKTGSIRSAIQAKVAEKVFASDKVFSHGRAFDIKNLYDIAHEMLREYFVEDIDDKIYEKRVSVYAAIDVLLNRIISFGATKELYKVYYGKEDDNNKPIAKLRGEDTCLNKTFDVQMRIYFQDIMNKKSPFWELIKQKSNKEQVDCIDNININIYEKNNLITDFYNYEMSKNLSFVPRWVPYGKTEDSAIWIIGIMNIFIYNAVKYGSIINNILGIKIEINSKDVNVKQRDNIITKKNCDIIISNNYCTSSDKMKDNIGLTYIFKDYFNSIKCVRNQEDYYISMGVDDNSGNYVSKIEFGKDNK